MFGHVSMDPTHENIFFVDFPWADGQPLLLSPCDSACFMKGPFTLRDVPAGNITIEYEKDGFIKVAVIFS